MGGIEGAAGAAGRALSRSTGVGGGERKATFFWTSMGGLEVAGDEPFVLRELRGVDSDVFEDESRDGSSGGRVVCGAFGVAVLRMDWVSACEGDGDDGRGRRSWDES